MTGLIDRIAAEHSALAAQSSPSAVAYARRRRALDALVARGLPTARDENWRYANLRPLERVRFAPARVASAAPAAPDLQAVASSLPAAVPGFERYVFVDGVFAERLSSGRGGPSGAPARVSTGVPAASTLDEGRPESAFALLNEAFAIDGLYVEAQEGARAARIEVVFAATAPAQQGASYPRLSVVAAPHARLELIERHVSPVEEPTFVDSAVEIRAHEGSSVRHYRIGQLGVRAAWMDTLAAAIARSAAYRVHGFALGGEAVRSSLHARLEGEGAELGLYAVAAGDRRQALDAYAVVEHAAPRTRTEENFRGVAAGRSRVAFNGKIVVLPGAHGADSSQSLRGLLAGAEAEIDLRPQLEIYTDDVRCSHGATAGKLDEAMLFYLLSRGLDRDTAQRLLKWAFLEDVVSRVEVTELRRQIEASLAGQLQETEALKELL